MTPARAIPDPDRRSQIIRLLETRDDRLPQPVRRGLPASGFVHDTLAPQVCPTCDGLDSKSCPGCGGRGEIEVRRRHDPYATRIVAQYGLTGDRHEAARERDRVIDRLDRQLAPPRSEADMLAEANARLDGWELARRRMWRSFDYAALDRGLDALRQVDPDACHLLHRVHVYALITVPAGGQAARVLDRGLAFLEKWMPDPIRAPEPDAPRRLARGRVARAAGRGALDQRDAEIRRAVLEARIPTADVARTWGLSVSQVNRIVKGEAA